MLTEIKDFFNGLTGASLTAITVLSVVVLAVAGFIATAYPLVSLVAALLFAAYLVPNLFDKFSTALGWLATAAKDLLVAITGFVSTIATTLLTLLKEIVLGLVGLLKELVTCLAQIIPYVVVAALIALLFVTMSPYGSYQIRLPRIFGGAEFQKRESPRTLLGGVSAGGAAGGIVAQAVASQNFSRKHGGYWQLSVTGDATENSPFGRTEEPLTVRMGEGGNSGLTANATMETPGGKTLVFLWNPRTGAGSWSKPGSGDGGRLATLWVDADTIRGTLSGEFMEPVEFTMIRS